MIIFNVMFVGMGGAVTWKHKMLPRGKNDK